jgi:hypothetical protein
MAGNEGDHKKDNGREETKDGDGLEDVEDGNHPGFDARVICGYVPVGDGEDKA